MCERYIQECRTMGRRKPGLDVRSRAGSAWGGRAYLVVEALKPEALHRKSSHMQELAYYSMQPELG